MDIFAVAFLLDISQYDYIRVTCTW